MIEKGVKYALYNKGIELSDEVIRGIVVFVQDVISAQFCYVYSKYTYLVAHHSGPSTPTRPLVVGHMSLDISL